MHSLDIQTAYAFTALATALCRQPSIDGQRLRMDFLDALEGIAKSPQGVGTVGVETAGLMDAILKSIHTSSVPPHP